MTLFTWKGIPVRLHISFLVLAAGAVLMDLVTAGLGGAFGSTLLGVAVFGSVLLHEFGHAFMARRFGIETRSITLYPFGGVAALTREPVTPRAELLVALAGPAVNIALFAIALPLAWAGLPGAATFAGLNLALGIFNLLPAFPMDGGRILRAWLSPKVGIVAATEKALNVSRWFAWAFVAIGVFASSPGLMLVGGFLLFTIFAERKRWQRVARSRRAPDWVINGRRALR